MKRLRPYVLLVLALCGSAATACAPKLGDACKPGQSGCDSAASALVCLDGKYAGVSCRGPLGCARVDGVSRCDDSIAIEGDGCESADDNACTADKRTLLTCKDHRFALATLCRGAGGCSVADETVTCDTGLAEPGDACRADGNHACSMDHAAMLVCQGGTFRAALACRGSAGCSVTGTHVDCDDSIARVGDACTATDDVACSSDGRSVLGCRDHVRELLRACKTQCDVRDHEVRCD